MGVNVKKLRRYINSILMAIFLLLPGLVLDFVHDQKITWNWATAVYECIRDCARWAGLHYDNVFQVLSNNLGVLITIVSLFLTMNINIAERSEKKVFGISRKELEDQGMGRWIRFFRVMRVIGFLAPLLMIACIIERWCITGYLLLLFCYIFLFSHYIYHSRTYDREHSIEQAVSLLKNSMKNSIETEKDFYKHQVRLNDFGQSVQRNAEWVSAEEVYLKVTDDIAAEKEGTLCLACGNFFKKGFADASSENAMYLLQKYIGRLDAVPTEMQGKGNGEELYGYAILWSMLCVWSEAADEMELLHFLNWFLNFGHRSKENVFGGGTAISQDRLGRQSLMLLLILERWLDANTPSERKTLDCIIQVWETGKVVLFHDDEFWGKLYLMYSEMNQKEYRIFEDYQLYLERFRRGVTEGMSQTIVQSLVMSL